VPLAVVAACRVAVVFAKVGQPCPKSKDANGEQCFALRDCCMPLSVCASGIRHLLTSTFFRVGRLMKASNNSRMVKIQGVQGSQTTDMVKATYNSCLVYSYVSFGFLGGRSRFKEDGLAFVVYHYTWLYHGFNGWYKIMGGHKLLNVLNDRRKGLNSLYENNDNLSALSPCWESNNVFKRLRAVESSLAA